MAPWVSVLRQALGGGREGGRERGRRQLIYVYLLQFLQDIIAAIDLMKSVLNGPGMRIVLIPSIPHYTLCIPMLVSEGLYAPGGV